MTTPIKYLKKELEKYGDPDCCEIKWEELDKLLDMADNMVVLEKVEAYSQAKRHYNETYNK